MGNWKRKMGGGVVVGALLLVAPGCASPQGATGAGADPLGQLGTLALGVGAAVGSAYLVNKITGN